jgi:hypothetical protein
MTVRQRGAAGGRDLVYAAGCEFWRHSSITIARWLGGRFCGICGGRAPLACGAGGCGSRDQILRCAYGLELDAPAAGESLATSGTISRCRPTVTKQ